MGASGGKEGGRPDPAVLNDGSRGLTVAKVTISVDGEPDQQLTSWRSDRPLFFPADGTFQATTEVRVDKSLKGVRFLHNLNHDIRVGIGEEYPGWRDITFMGEQLEFVDGEEAHNLRMKSNKPLMLRPSGDFDPEKEITGRVMLGDFKQSERNYSWQSHKIRVPPTWPKQFTSFVYYIDGDGLVLARLAFTGVLIDSSDNIRMSAVNFERTHRDHQFEFLANERTFRQVSTRAHAWSWGRLGGGVHCCLVSRVRLAC